MPATDQERLVVSLEARVAQFEKQMLKANRTGSKAFDDLEARAKKSATRMEQAMSGAATRVGTALKGFGAGFVGGLAAGGLTGIVNEIGAVAKGMAEIGDQAKRAGLSTKAFQELSYVAKASRIGVDALTDGMKELNLRADEFITTGGGSAAESFQRLGYSAAELKDKLKDPSALFTEIIGKLGQLDRAAQIRIADELFGGTGGEQFVQLIGQGEAGIKRLIQAAHETGSVFEDELIAKAAELDLKLQDLNLRVGNGFKQAIIEAASAFSDFIRQVEGYLPTVQGLAGNVKLPAGTTVGPGGALVSNVDVLEGQRSQILKDIRITENGINAGIESRLPDDLIAAEQERLAALRKRLGIVQEQIRQQQRLNAEKERTVELEEVVVTGPRSSTGGPARYRQPGEVPLPATTDFTVDHREEPLLYGDPPDAAATGAQAGDSMAVAFIKRFEGFRSSAYWDVNAYRAGYGSDTTTRANGSVEAVTASTVVSLADANRDLSRRLVDFQSGIRGKIGADTFASFSEEQQAALTSIAYNYGELPDRIVAAILRGTPESVGTAIRDLGDDNGGVNRKRRAQEADLFFSGSGGGNTPGMEAATAGLKAQEEATDALKARYQQLGQIGIGAFQGIANAMADGKLDASELVSIIGQIITQLLSMPALPAGATGGGGGFGSILGSLFGLFTGGGADPWAGLRLAGGGHVRGPGTSTSDSIPAQLSNGEFVVNARQTAKHRALLEAINRGDALRLADGGMAGKPLASPIVRGAGSPSFVSSPTINIKMEGNASADPQAQQEQADKIGKAVTEQTRQEMARFAQDNMRNGGMFNQRSFT